MKPLTNTLFALSLLLLPLASCAKRATGRGLLPPPPPGAVKESPYRPERPLETRADGLLSRRIQAATAAPFTAELHDWIVPPGRKIAVVETGAVVALTLHGTGIVRQGGKDTEARPGVAFALSEGERAEIENNGKEPLSMRVYIVRGQ